MLGAAPTGRAARELGDAAGVESFTIHRVVSDLEQSGGLAPRTVVLFDEAGSAPTRPSAALLVHAERAGAKLIAAGDGGQLPSVAAGGWFAAIARELGGPELRQVVRQRDRNERDALESLHDGDPEPYVEIKRKERSLIARREEIETRIVLNEQARLVLLSQGVIAARGVMVAGQEFAVGDRVIARRNDRYRDVDNGTLGRVESIDGRTGALARAGAHACM